MATGNWVLRRARDFCRVCPVGRPRCGDCHLPLAKADVIRVAKKQDDGQLRADLLTLQAVTLSQVREDTPSDLQKAADYLGTIRSAKRPELRPVLDLQIASDYVEMARLEREAG